MFESLDSIVNRWRACELTASRRLSRALAHSLFPPRCCLCHHPGMSADLDLCEVCHADLPWVPDPDSTALIPLGFAPPVDELVRRLKYHGVIANARVLGALLAQAAAEREPSLPRLLVPVPLHVARLKERGFNQAFAIARYAGRLLGIPTAREAVVRQRDTPSQTTLDMNARRANVDGAFAVTSKRACTRLREVGHVAIVDDVMTTGSTAAELKLTLLAAGLARVDVWAVARVD